MANLTLPESVTIAYAVESVWRLLAWSRLASPDLVVQAGYAAAALCGLRDCKNIHAPFPGQMSYKVTKPGLVCFIS